MAREARADVPKAEEAETTVSAEQTVVARAADSVRDREEAVELQILYSSGTGADQDIQGQQA